MSANSFSFWGNSSPDPRGGTFVPDHLGYTPPQTTEIADAVTDKNEKISSLLKPKLKQINTENENVSTA